MMPEPGQQFAHELTYLRLIWHTDDVVSAVSRFFFFKGISHVNKGCVHQI